jgi:predicted GIY-YIG superfamily endonuclease
MLEQVKDLYFDRYGITVDTEERVSEHVDTDGTLWSKSMYAEKPDLSKLEEQLVEVKDLYFEKYGITTDTCEDVSDWYVDADGMQWSMSIYRQELDLVALEEKLEDVKAAYFDVYGITVDTVERISDHVDNDGTDWTKTVYSHAIDINLSMLESSLADVKDLYFDKYGITVETEERVLECVDADGTMWSKTQYAPKPDSSSLEEQLDAVKDLYFEKYGITVGTDEGISESVDDDGSIWVCCVYKQEPSLESLQQKLAAVKDSYFLKFGMSVDDEDGEYEAIPGFEWNDSYFLKFDKFVDDEDAEHEALPGFEW